MGVYLYYDVKGIQSFIFKIPKLKFIVGGSALIDQFDKETIPNIVDKETIPNQAIDGVDKLLFTGGGRGAFFCDSIKSAKNLKQQIKKRAKEIGLDISFGLDEKFSSALQMTDEFYPFVPDLPENGEPCPESGLYPVDMEKLKTSKKTCHEVIEHRMFKSGEKTFRRFEETLLKKLPEIKNPNGSVEFFHNVNPDDVPDGNAGARALGGRNRWAIICMDGNDMGHQFRTFLDRSPSQEDAVKGIQEMSQTVNKITENATIRGIRHVVGQWARNEGKEDVCKRGKITLPIRPLLVGGDDIVVLCRCNYATAFVKEVAQVFEEESRKNKKLWPATANGLTISAGILFTSVTLPLHTAIPYAEALLKNAKALGRKKANPGHAPPACIDWEQVTESVIDTPNAKRQRELVFFDEEIGQCIQLTKRPYTMEDFNKLETTAATFKGDGGLPRTIRHQILPALQQGLEERLAFAAQVKKNHPGLFDHLNELVLEKSAWKEDFENKSRTNWLPDALLLIEEEDRMREESDQ